MTRCLHLAMLIIILAAGLPSQAVFGSVESQAVENLLAGRFNWTISPPLVAPLQRPGEQIYSVKDPTIVRYKDKWHLFCTIRGKQRSHQIEYLCFDD